MPFKLLDVYFLYRMLSVQQVDFLLVARKHVKNITGK